MLGNLLAKSGPFGLAIIVLALINALVLIRLWWTESRWKRDVEQHLDSLPREAQKTQRDDRHSGNLDRKLWATISDLRANPPRRPEVIGSFLGKLESNKVQLPLMHFRLQSISGSLVEVYPLLGIMGTLAALAGLGPGGFSGPAIMSAFAESVGSTLLGLVMSALFLAVRAFSAPSTTRTQAQLDTINRFLEDLRSQLASMALSDDAKV